MYLPRVFSESRSEVVFDLLERYAFGALVVVREDGEVEIAHAPFVIDREKQELRAHFSRHNPVIGAALGKRATAVFQGPHGYVSASWYEHPSEQVPTWNYAAVHVTGMVSGPLAASELIELLRQLTLANESSGGETGSGPEARWSLDLLDPELTHQLTGQIVGVRLSIEKLEAKLKLSQNRSEADQARVIDALERRATDDDRAMIELMKGPASPTKTQKSRG